MKAMQSDAYARKVKITNLQQMANTLIYIQEHGYDTREDLSAVTSKAKEDLNEARNTLNELTAELKTLNAQIHYTGQYFSTKSIYAEFIKSKRKRYSAVNMVPNCRHTNRPETGLKTSILMGKCFR